MVVWWLQRSFKTMMSNCSKMASPSLRQEVFSFRFRYIFFSLEITLLKQVSHPNVISLLQLIVSAPSPRNQHRGSFFLVFDYLQHDLAGLLKRRTRFDMPQIKCILHQLLLGLSYLHSRRILHRDIKSANVLLNDAGVVRIADFGLGRKAEGDQLTNKVVTLWYRAPQLLKGCKNYDGRVDIWAAGCVAVQMLTGEVLFKRDTECASLQKIEEMCGTKTINLNNGSYMGSNSINNTPYKSNEHEHKVNEQSKNFQKKTQQSQTQLSLYIKNEYPLITPLGLHFLQKLLSLDPINRLTADEALSHPFFNEWPFACEPHQIRKMQFECHEMDKNIPIERKISSSIEEQSRERSIQYEKYDSKYQKHSINYQYTHKNNTIKVHHNKQYQKKIYRTSHQDRNSNKLEIEKESQRYKNGTYRRRSPNQKQYFQNRREKKQYHQREKQKNIQYQRKRQYERRKNHQRYSKQYQSHQINEKYSKDQSSRRHQKDKKYLRDNEMDVEYQSHRNHSKQEIHKRHKSPRKYYREHSIQRYDERKHLKVRIDDSHYQSSAKEDLYRIRSKGKTNQQYQREHQKQRRHYHQKKHLNEEQYKRKSSKQYSKQRQYHRRQQKQDEHHRRHSIQNSSYKRRSKQNQNDKKYIRDQFYEKKLFKQKKEEPYYKKSSRQQQYRRRYSKEKKIYHEDNRQQRQDVRYEKWDTYREKKQKEDYCEYENNKKQDDKINKNYKR